MGGSRAVTKELITGPPTLDKAQTRAAFLALLAGKMGYGDDQAHGAFAALSGMNGREMVDLLAEIAAELGKPTPGLLYTSRDGQQTWPLDRDDPPPQMPPGEAELAVLAALLDVAATRVRRWTATTAQ